MKRKLRIKGETIAVLSAARLVTVMGGDNRLVTVSELYSFCGMCVPVTYMTCGCAS